MDGGVRGAPCIAIPFDLAAGVARARKARHQRAGFRSDSDSERAEFYIARAITAGSRVPRACAPVDAPLGRTAGGFVVRRNRAVPRANGDGLDFDPSHPPPRKASRSWRTSDDAPTTRNTQARRRIRNGAGQYADKLRSAPACYLPAARRIGMDRTAAQARAVARTRAH